MIKLDFRISIMPPVTSKGIVVSAVCGMLAVLIVNMTIETALHLPGWTTSMTLSWPSNLVTPIQRVLSRSNCEWTRRPTITPEKGEETRPREPASPEEAELVEYEYVCRQPCLTSAEKLFTATQLSLYTGQADSQGLYLAILGEVFDVEKGAQHYKPGGGYAFFSGRDATRAYVTGDFSENGLIDDVEGLDEDSLLGIEEWLHFYRTEYTYVGKLVGRYYDEQGCPTPQLEKVLQILEDTHKKQEKEEEEKVIFPPCNSEWNVEKQTGRVWCSNMSGGIEREWVGVPRKLFRLGHGEPRCVCVRDKGPPSGEHHGAEEYTDIGDLGNPSLQEYPDCEPTSVSCPLRNT